MRLQSLREEVEVAVHAKTFADTELDKIKSLSGSQLGSSISEEMAEQLKDQVVALQDHKASADAREDRLTENLKALQKEVEEAVYAKYVAEAELDERKTYSASQTSTEVQELASELEAAKDDAAITKMHLESRVESLEDLASNLKLAKDNAASAKRCSDDLLRERIESLQQDVKTAISAKLEVETQLQRFKGWPGSEVSSELAEKSKNVDKMQERISSDNATKKVLKGQLKAADDTICGLKDEIVVLMQQALVLSSGKQLAEEGVRALLSSREDTSSTSTVDAIRPKHIGQLKAEKKLSCDLASKF